MDLCVMQVGVVFKEFVKTHAMVLFALLHHPLIVVGLEYVSATKVLVNVFIHPSMKHKSVVTRVIARSALVAYVQSQVDVK